MLVSNRLRTIPNGSRSTIEVWCSTSTEETRNSIIVLIMVIRFLSSSLMMMDIVRWAENNSAWTSPNPATHIDRLSQRKVWAKFPLHSSLNTEMRNECPFTSEAHGAPNSRHATVHACGVSKFVCVFHKTIAPSTPSDDSRILPLFSTSPCDGHS